jgi:hypothetical protein
LKRDIDRPCFETKAPEEKLRNFRKWAVANAVVAPGALLKPASIVGRLQLIDQSPEIALISYHDIMI